MRGKPRFPSPICPLRYTVPVWNSACQRTIVTSLRAKHVRINKKRSPSLFATGLRLGVSTFACVFRAKNLLSISSETSDFFIPYRLCIFIIHPTLMLMVVQTTRLVLIHTATPITLTITKRRAVAPVVAMDTVLPFRNESP